VDGRLHGGSAHEADAVEKRPEIADIERGLVAVEPDIGELLDWFKETGTSIDWIVSGDVRPIAEAFRREKLLQNAREEIDEGAEDIDLD
jgi:hypothetical protein